jgi:uncharacterized membrane protein YfbV (UPF0208 family)
MAMPAMAVMAVMAMPVMTVMTVSVMAVMAMSVMAVAFAVTTASEGLTRNGQRSRCQCQSSDTGHNDLVDPSHEHLLGWAARGSPCDDPT